MRATDLQRFIDSNPRVKSWVERLSKKSVATARVFASQLFNYWENYLSKAPRSFKSLASWEASVLEQIESKDIDTRTTWARDLEEYVQTHYHMRRKTR